MSYRLGRLPIKRDPRVMSLASYKRGLALTAPPPMVDYHSKINSWGMCLNDRLGDCTIAALAHCILQWTTYTKPTPVALTDAQVLSIYEYDGGYNPADPSTDQGCVETEVLQNWMKGAAGDTLSGYVAVNVSDLDEVRDSINWFANSYIGINCPQSALQNTEIWDVVPNSPIEGGHAVILVGYDTSYFYAVSWGMLIKVTPAFLSTYMEEAYALLNRDWLMSSSVSPSGLNWQQMIADSQQLKQAA